MLAADIIIEKIDYEKTLEGIFPLLKVELDKMKSSNMVVRLMQKLGDAALPIALNIMESLPEESKRDLLVMLMNACPNQVRDLVVAELKKRYLGQYVSLGNIFAVNSSNAVCLRLGHIKVEYGALIRRFLPGGFIAFANIFKKLEGEALENFAVKNLWTKSNKQRVLIYTDKALNDHCIIAGVKDIQVMQDRSELKAVTVVDSELQLPEELEEAILDAVAGYLQDRR